MRSLNKSGKRKAVVISCVTFETAKVVEPIKFYNADVAHLIHFDSKGGGVYTEFYDRVIELINEPDGTSNIEIVEHNERVYKFKDMMRTILKIIDEEREKDDYADIFVNVSAGTSEYTAAAVIASMMNDGVIAFTVSTEKYTISDDRIRDIYYEGGVPVGLCKSTHDPTMLPNYIIDKPEKNLVDGLRILDEKNMNREPTTAPEMISILRENKTWKRDDYTTNKNKDPYKSKRTESVHYQRDFIDKWKGLNWVERDSFGKKYVVTKEGKIVLETFYVPSETNF